MHTLQYYDNITPCEFFNKNEVKQCLIRFIKAYGNFGGGGGSSTLQEVTDNGNTTSNLVAFTGLTNGQSVSGIHIGSGIILSGNPVTPTFAPISFLTGDFGVSARGNISFHTSSLGTASFDSTVSGLDGVAPTDFATKGQLDAVNLQKVLTSGNTATSSILLSGTATFQTTSSHTTSTPLTQSQVIINDTGVGGDASILFNVKGTGTNTDGYFYIDINPVQIGSGPSSTTSTISTFVTKYLGAAKTLLTLNPIAFTGMAQAIFTGTVSGNDAINNNEYMTLGQYNITHKGGQTPFVANGTSTVVTITHNLGSIPSYYALTTSEPISANHLNRTITFPDVNTMLITFSAPPIPGEDANYVWIVYK